MTRVTHNPLLSSPHDTPRLVLGGVRVAATTRRALALGMVEDCRRIRALGQPAKLVFSLNGQGLSLAAQAQDHRADLEAAEIVHADGMSVVFASRLLTRTPLPERVATTDFFHDAAQAAIKEGLSFYFLGGTATQHDAALAQIRKLYPALRISGARHGYFTSDQVPAICDEIVRAGTDVLWLGLGKPRQEAFAHASRARLRGVGWIKTCGGLFDFLAGRRRAPEWMQAAGLEWLHRMAQEPQRLTQRYLLTNLHALWRLGAASRTRAV